MALCLGLVVLPVRAAPPLPEPSVQPELPLATFEFPPFHFRQEGQLRGASVEIINRVLGRLGYRPVYSMMPWRRAQRVAASGDYAGVFTFTYSPARAELFYYSAPLTSITDVFYRRAAEPIRWQRLADLAPYRIGVSGGYNYVPAFMQAMAEGALQIEVISATAPERQQIEQLRLGRIDLALCIQSRCEHLRRQEPALFEGIVPVSPPVGPPRGFHVGFAKRWPGAETLRDRFNQALAEARDSGEIDAILARYSLP